MFNLAKKQGNYVPIVSCSYEAVDIVTRAKLCAGYVFALVLLVIEYTKYSLAGILAATVQLEAKYYYGNIVRGRA